MHRKTAMFSLSDVISRSTVEDRWPTAAVGSPTRHQTVLSHVASTSDKSRFASTWLGPSDGIRVSLSCLMIGVTEIWFSFDQRSVVKARGDRHVARSYQPFRRKRSSMSESCREEKWGIGEDLVRLGDYEFWLGFFLFFFFFFMILIWFFLWSGVAERVTFVTWVYLSLAKLPNKPWICLLRRLYPWGLVHAKIYSRVLFLSISF